MEKNTIFDTKNKIKTIFNTKSPSLSFLLNQALPFALNPLHFYFLLQSGPPLFLGLGTRAGQSPRQLAGGGRPPGAPRNLLLPVTKTPKKLPHFPCLQPPAMAGTELKLGRRWPATHGPPRPNTPSRGAPPIRGEATPANYWALEAPEQGAPLRPPAAAPAHGGARAFRPPTTTIRPARDFYTFYDL